VLEGCERERRSCPDCELVKNDTGVIQPVAEVDRVCRERYHVTSTQSGGRTKPNRRSTPSAP